MSSAHLSTLPFCSKGTTCFVTFTHPIPLSTFFSISDQCGPGRAGTAGSNGSMLPAAALRTGSREFVSHVTNFTPQPLFL